MSLFHFGITLILPSESYNPEKSMDTLVEQQYNKKERISKLLKIKFFRCDCIYGTPTMFIDLISIQRKRKENLKLEMIVCASAPASPILFNQIKEVLMVNSIKVCF